MELAPRPSHVLVYDDDPALVDRYATLLARAGHRVTIRRRTPVDAFDVSAVGADLVVLDLLVEFGDAGTGFISQLRAHPATHDLPIVVCSADTERLRGLATRLRAWGCIVVTKPFADGTLLEAVRSGLRPGTSSPTGLREAA